MSPRASHQFQASPSRPSFRGVAARALMVLLPLACACQMQDKGNNHGVSAVQFQDVVVPTGLLLQDRAHESHSLETAGWREGRFIYQGNTRIEDAVAYVRQRMPQHSWEVVGSEELPQKGFRLRFARGIYSADYTFERLEGITQMVVDYATDYSRR